jgi:hypothetical protein
MDDAVSPYYPPRARWYSRILYLWFAVRRGLYRAKSCLPSGISTCQFLLSVILPGYAFLGKGRRVAGRLVLAAYGLGWLIFVIALGYPIGSVGFGLIVGAHATSLIYLQGYWLREACRPGFRFVLAVLTLLAVSLGAYWPLVGFVEAHWLMPLRLDGRVFVVSRTSSQLSLKRGDWAAFRLPGNGSGGVNVQEGFGLGPVLAVGGDRIEFGANTFKVNGVPQARLAYMPTAGELVLPENHWFLWPNYAISGGHQEVAEATLSAILLQRATVGQDQFIGTPYRRWFGRRQVVP